MHNYGTTGEVNSAGVERRDTSPSLLTIDDHSVLLPVGMTPRRCVVLLCAIALALTTPAVDACGLSAIAAVAAPLLLEAAPALLEAAAPMIAEAVPALAEAAPGLGEIASTASEAGGISNLLKGAPKLMEHIPGLIDMAKKNGLSNLNNARRAQQKAIDLSGGAADRLRAKTASLMGRARTNFGLGRGGRLRRQADREVVYAPGDDVELEDDDDSYAPARDSGRRRIVYSRQRG